MKNALAEALDWLKEFIAFSLVALFSVAVALSAFYLFQVMYYGGI